MKNRNFFGWPEHTSEKMAFADWVKWSKPSWFQRKSRALFRGEKFRNRFATTVAGRRFLGFTTLAYTRSSLKRENGRWVLSIYLTGYVRQEFVGTTIRELLSIFWEATGIHADTFLSQGSQELYQRERDRQIFFRRKFFTPVTWMHLVFNQPLPSEPELKNIRKKISTKPVRKPRKKISTKPVRNPLKKNKK